MIQALRDDEEVCERCGWTVLKGGAHVCVPKPKGVRVYQLPESDKTKPVVPTKIEPSAFRAAKERDEVPRARPAAKPVEDEEEDIF